MDCIARDEIREGDLMAYVEGQASESVRRHIARCPACAAEAQSLARAAQVLSKSLYRLSCPETPVLMQYQAQSLPPDERDKLAAHLRTCLHCMSELRRLAAADLVPSDQRPSLLDAARALIEAVLVPPTPALAMAARGGEPLPQLYRAGDLDVFIGVEPPTPGRQDWLVRGRITQQGRAISGASMQPVCLVQQAQVIACVPMDEVGYFVFESVPSGEYDVWLEHTLADILVRGLRLGERRAANTDR